MISKAFAKKGTAYFSLSFHFYKYKYCKHCSGKPTYALTISSGVDPINIQDFLDLKIPIVYHNKKSPSIEYCNVAGNKMRFSARKNFATYILCKCAQSYWLIDSGITYSTKPHVLNRRAKQVSKFGIYSP